EGGSGRQARARAGRVRAAARRRRARDRAVLRGPLERSRGTVLAPARVRGRGAASVLWLRALARRGRMARASARALRATAEPPARVPVSVAPRRGLLLRCGRARARGRVRALGVAGATSRPCARSL